MKFNKKNKILAAALSVLAVSVGVWWVYSLRYEETDNAYISAHVATLSAKVPGLVTRVLIEENYKVKKDQILVRIDDRDYTNVVDSLHAQLGVVEASLVLAEKDLNRSNHLYGQKAVPQQEVDNDLARVQEFKKKREGLNAQLSQAELNLGFTQIRAPSDGTVGKKLVEPGMVTSAGQPLLSFVDSQAPWVVANFKETQLRKMKVGQKCEIEIDSISGKVFEGAIESFSPGTGATFALIPPENATGNFTKIVQRIPVRIRFLEDSIRGFEDRIVPGLSVEARVDLNSEVEKTPKTVNPQLSES